MEKQKDFSDKAHFGFGSLTEIRKAPARLDFKPNLHFWTGYNEGIKGNGY